MAEKWGNHEASYKDAENILKKYGPKLVQAEVTKFLGHYKACQEMETKLGHMVVKARTNGVTGDTLADFKKNKDFYDVYKALDKEVDGLWKAQVQAKMMGNEAKQGVSDLKILTEHIEADLKKHEKELAEAQEDLKKDQAKAKAGKGTVTPSMVKAVEVLQKELKKREADLGKMLKQIVGDSKDLTEAGSIWKREVDLKMDSYAAKFKKMIEKLLDLAPKDGAKEAGLPTDLTARVLTVAVKKAVEQGKGIGKLLKSALEKAAKDRALAGPDLKAAKVMLDQLKKMHLALAAKKKKNAAAIKKAKDSKDLERQFKLAEAAFKDAEKAMVTTMKEIAGMK